MPITITSLGKSNYRWWFIFKERKISPNAELQRKPFHNPPPFQHVHRRGGKNVEEYEAVITKNKIHATKETKPTQPEISIAFLNICGCHTKPNTRIGKCSQISCPGTQGY